MVVPAEIREKERRVRAFMEQKDLSGVLLKRQANFSWMTGSGLNLVGITSELGAASLLITKDAKFVICNNIEAPRMEEEEDLKSQGFVLKSYLWHEDQEVPIIRELMGSGRLGSDAPFPDSIVLPEDIARLRYSLTPEEHERYRWLGESVSLALETTLLETRKGEKESEVVGRLCNELWKDRIDPVTLTSAADDRVFRFRHPIPTEKKIQNYLMVSVNARKWGLIVSLTRFVHFGKVPEDLKEKYNANVFIDCCFMANTRPGLLASEVLRKGIQAYEKAGYSDEWKYHHQGGSIGYTGRDYRTGCNTPDIIQENQAFIPFDVAAITEPIAVCVTSIVERCGLQAGESVVVTGPGPIGLISVAVAKAAGAKTILVTGRSSGEGIRFEIARELGADHTIDVDKANAIQKVLGVTDGLGADMLIEGSGGSPAIYQAFEMVRRLGRICAIGISGKQEVPIPYDKAIFKALRYDFCFSSSWTAWEKTLGLISKGSIPAGKLITHRLPLDQWETAFHLLENREAAKIILLP